MRTSAWLQNRPCGPLVGECEPVCRHRRTRVSRCSARKFQNVTAKQMSAYTNASDSFAEPNGGTSAALLAKE